MKLDTTKFTDGIKSFTNSLANSRNANATNGMASSMRLPYVEQNNIYKTGLGNKIVSLKINTAFKEGLIIDDNVEQTKDMKHLIKEIRTAARWMLVFGRGVITIIEEGKATHEPLGNVLNLNRVQVRAFDGSMVTGNTATVDVIDENYMKPEQYVIRGRVFHPSRIIDFSYIKPREEDLPTYQYGGISEYDLIYNQLINDGVVERASASIIEKNSNLFYKIKGFKNLLQTGKENSLVQYFKQMEDLRSIYGAGLIDQEDSVEVHAQTLSNLSEVDMITLRRLAMVTSIPVAILVGESVKGMNGTGDNEMETFYIAIENLQENYLLDPINEAFRKLGLAEEVSFQHPEQMTPIQRAELDSKILDNALKMQSLGYDPTAMIEESEINTGNSDDEFNEFIEIEGLENDNELEPKKEQESESVDPNSSLNGAQVSAILDIVQKVKSGELKKTTGREIMITSFPISAQRADEILEDVDEGSLKEENADTTE